jgi:L-asparaginase
MLKTHIHFIKMGGTIEFIDPAYDAINSKLMKLDSSIESFLHNLIQPHFTYSIESVTEKDSREINEDDRKKLIKAVESTSHSNIVVTHGTFTMRDTALYLDKVSFGDKKIIFTGSMIPLVGFSASDGGFNLGFAVATFMGIDPGIYICMNGSVFKPEEVDKNKELLRFE